MFRDVSTNPEVRQNYQLIPLYSRSVLFKALPFAPKVIDAVGNLIGHPVIKILDQSFYKPPHSGMGTSWHTDNAYFKLRDPLRGTAMWIAIHDGDVSNGTLKVVPGAFNEDLPHTRDPASDHHIRTELDESRAVNLKLAAWCSFVLVHPMRPETIRVMILASALEFTSSIRITCRLYTRNVGNRRSYRMRALARSSPMKCARLSFGPKAEILTT